MELEPLTRTGPNHKAKCFPVLTRNRHPYTAGKVRLMMSGLPKVEWPGFRRAMIHACSKVRVRLPLLRERAG
jgi:hypothetical protein